MTALPSNIADFLAGIFGTLPPGVTPWVCGLAGNPKDKAARWAGRSWTPGAPIDDPLLNWFFSLATYRPDVDGIYRRRSALWVANHGVMLDDIGTKVDASRLLALPPSIAVQTSEGNGQSFYLFPEPVTDLGAVDALQDSLIAAGLCDENAHGPSARYSRMPFGINGKHTPPHQCRLIEWHPERRYTVDAIVQGLNLPALVQRVPTQFRESKTLLWESKTPNEQRQIVDDLRAALAYIPSDTRRVWSDVGHYLRTLPDEISYVLFEDWSRKSEAFDEDGMLKFWGFNPTRSDFRAVFNLGERHGWVNPRRAAAAVVFARADDVPPSVSTAAAAADSPAAWGVARYGVAASDPLGTARVLIAEQYAHGEGSRLRSWQGACYRWGGAHWREMKDDDLRAVLYDFLDRHGESHFRPKQSVVSNLADAIQHAAGVHLESTYAPPCWIAGEPVASPAELVACSNGLLHLPTRSVLPATPRFFNLNAVPYAYDPHAAQPTQWLQFLNTVWPDDPEAIATLQELFGYMLTPNTSQQKIFLIVGPKRSGKGTIARVLTEMLGAENVTGPTLASVAGQFGLQSLVGSLAAIVSDARLGGKTDSASVAENLLRISGEDRIEVARKNLPALTVRLGTRFVLLTNELPRIADASGAMASRFVILTMSQSFFGREDPGLTARLLRELPGVLLWAVEGWHRLHARGHFVEPKSSAGAAQELADLGSPIGAFVRDECSCSPVAEVEVGELFGKWRDWCARQGMQHAGTLQTFGRDLRAAFPSITQARPRTGGERVRVYRGIAARGPQWSASHPIAAHAAHTPG